MDSLITKHIKLHTKILFIYTSGTTGLPKAAVMTHNRFVFLAVAIHKTMRLSRNEVVYTPMPLFHTAGGLLGTGQVLLFGNTMVTRKKFSATGYFPDCRKYGVTVAQYIGEMASFIMARVKEVKEHNVKIMIGNGMRPEIWEEFKKRYKIERIGEFYGSTEGNANMINNCNQPGAVGFIPWYGHSVLPMYLIEYDPETAEPIKDEKTGRCREVAAGKPGLLVSRIKSCSSGTFDGYADAKATQKKIITNVFKEGDRYFNTGDVLRKDEKGFFYFMDRLGDTFRWNGENVAASEVEMVIFKGLDLQPNQVAVFGVQIPNRPGKAGMAAFALSDAEKSTFSLDKLTAELTAHLSDPQTPVFLRIGTDLPKTATEKVKKAELQLQGYDPATVPDVLYYKVRDRATKTITYAPLTAEVHSRIQAGTLEL